MQRSSFSISISVHLSLSCRPSVLYIQPGSAVSLAASLLLLPPSPSLQGASLCFPASSLLSVFNPEFERLAAELLLFPPPSRSTRRRSRLGASSAESDLRTTRVVK